MGATEGLHVLCSNGVQLIVGVVGFKGVFDDNGASDGLGLRLPNDLHGIVDVTGSNGVLDPTAWW